MDSTGKSTFTPPVFCNRGNCCASASAYQLMIAMLLRLGVSFDVPASDTPSRMAFAYRQAKKMQRGALLSSVVFWRDLLKEPPDEIFRLVRDALGDPKRLMFWKKTGKRTKEDFPVFSLCGGQSLKEDIQSALNGADGAETTDGRVFTRTPKLLLCELPVTNRQWHSRDIDLELVTFDYRKTQKPVKVRANMVGFVVDHMGHYSAVVRYGSQWWHTDSAGKQGMLALTEAINLFKAKGYLSAFHLEEVQ